MEKEIDFLMSEDETLSDKNQRLRNEAINTLKSYSHYWDIFSELFQNAVDAIEENINVKKGKIEFTFDKKKKIISIKDNGIGINMDEFIRIFKPHVTFKVGKESLRGEKGVGLSFILFSTNRIEINTSDGKKIINGRIKNSFKWITGEIEKIPKLIYSVKEEKSEPFTEIILHEINSLQDDLNIFEYNLGKLKYILRTKTAAGNTAKLFNLQPKKKIDITLNFINENNETIIDKIPYEFDSPENYIKPNLSLKDRKEKKAEGSDRMVRGKAVHNSYLTTSTSGRSIKVYYFVCSRYKYHNMSNTILGYEDKDFIQGRIFISTKNMPTGIEISPPSIGKAGYWANLYIVVEYDDLNLDMGRKSVPPRITRMIRDEVEKIYKELAKHFSDIVDTDDDTEQLLDAELTISEIWDKLDSYDDIGMKNVNFAKYPDAEQGVVAIFNELIGNKMVKGYSTWRTNSKDKYDSFVKYKTEKGKTYKIIIEFKLNGSDIIKDIHENIKDYNKINLLVCWDIDKRIFKAEDFDIIELSSDDDKFYFGATHKIVIPQITNHIHVLALKTFLKL